MANVFIECHYSKTGFGRSEKQILKSEKACNTISCKRHTHGQGEHVGSQN